MLVYPFMSTSLYAFPRVQGFVLSKTCQPRDKSTNRLLMTVKQPFDGFLNDCYGAFASA